MLADDHRPFLARLDVLGHQQDSPGDHVGIDIDGGFPAAVGRSVEDLPGADIEGNRRFRQSSDQLVVDHVAVRLDAVGPGLEVRAVGPSPELVPQLGTASEQSLCEGDQFADLLSLPTSGIGQRAVGGWLRAQGDQLAGPSEPLEEGGERPGRAG